MGGEAEAANQLGSFLSVYYRHGVGISEHLEPYVKVHPRTFFEKAGELAYVVVAEGGVGACLDDGKRKDSVDVVERLHLQARGAPAARIAVVAVGAVDILRKGPCEGELCRAFGSLQQQGVRQTVVVDKGTQPVLDIFVPGDITEFHLGKGTQILPIPQYRDR